MLINREGGGISGAVGKLMPLPPSVYPPGRPGVLLEVLLKECFKKHPTPIVVLALSEPGLGEYDSAVYHGVTFSGTREATLVSRWGGSVWVAQA